MSNSVSKGFGHATTAGSMESFLTVLHIVHTSHHIASNPLLNIKTNLDKPQYRDANLKLKNRLWGIVA